MLPLARLLGASEWKRLLSLASPSFFKVVPAKDLLSAVRKGVGQSRDTGAFERRLARLPHTFRRGGSGEAALELYFLQILTSRSCLLDLSRAAFHEGGPEGPLWVPSKLRYVFEPRFHAGLVEVYEGYYLGDAAAYGLALAKLGLERGDDNLKAHLGEGDSSEVRFSVPGFVSSFERIFRACKERGIALSGEFVALTTFLALLYEHLDSLAPGGTWDVRAAFLRARIRALAQGDVPGTGARSWSGAQ